MPCGVFHEHHNPHKFVDTRPEKAYRADLSSVTGEAYQGKYVLPLTEWVT